MAGAGQTWEAGVARGARTPFEHPAWLAGHVTVLEPDLVALDGLDVGAGAGAGVVVDSSGTVRLVGDAMSDWVEIGVGALDAAVRTARALGRPLRLGPIPLERAWDLAARWPVARLEEVVECPEVRFAGRTWDEYLAGPAARRRRRIVRAADRLLADPAATIVEACRPDEVARAVPVLVDLHHQRFGARSDAFDPPKDAFVAQVLPEMARDGAVVIRTLHLDGRATASLLCFVVDRTWWYYQMGWDPRWARSSVGRALFADTVRSACTAGSDLLLLRGDEEYKAWWATDVAAVATVAISW